MLQARSCLTEIEFFRTEPQGRDTPSCLHGYWVRVEALRPALSAVTSAACNVQASDYDARAVDNWPSKFKIAFCSRFACSEADYVRRVLGRCLYRRAFFVRPVLRVLRPDFFQVDLDTIERVGDAENWGAFRAELAAFSSENRMRSGFFRNRFKIRISGNRLSQLAEELFGPQPVTGPSLDPDRVADQELSA